MPHVKYRSPSIAPAYTGRLSTDPIPSLRLPDEPMEPAAAYRFIHDELMLDGSSRLNLATFVTTWMDPEAEKLMAETFDKNMIDKDEYPATAAIESRCVAMVADLFHAENLRDDDAATAVGASTIGSSEAVMLGGLALKWQWKKRVGGKDGNGWKGRTPNLVMGSNVQVVWEKFCRYWEIEPRYIPMRKGRYVISAEEVAARTDEQTIGVVAILGTTFTGEFEPIEAIHEALVEQNAKTGWQIPMHIDAASGGFVAPFLHPDLKWDFRLPLVKSINVSGHKYGLVYPGIGWVVWRNEDALPEDLVFHVNYLGGDMATYSLNFSRPASGVLAQYYNFLRLGREGYSNVMRSLKANADFIREGLLASKQFTLLSDDHSLPLVAFGCKPEDPFTAFDLADKVRERGWIVPAYTMPHDAESVTCLRVVVREGMSRDMASNLVRDLLWAAAELQKTKPKLAADYVERMRKHGIC